jgi:propanol-preferring alcohol dehydrogenase
MVSFRPGDRVAVAQVRFPKNEFAWENAVGLDVDGGHTEYCIANARQVVHVPANVSLHLAAVATDAVSTAYHAVVTEVEAGSGRNIAILGLGGLGLKGNVAASLRGANVYGLT